MAATAVAPQETLDKIRSEVDEVVCLHAAPVFHAVGEFFRDFAPVSDDEVMDLLAQADTRPATLTPSSPFHQKDDK